MSFLKKGPEIKLPKLKGREPKPGGGPRVPDGILDIYYELKERHLLPLVAVLLVAIVAVPIALSEGGGKKGNGEGAGAIAGISGAPAADKSRVVVAKSIPGLRNYKERLEHQSERNPFEAPPEAEEAKEAVNEAEEALNEAINEAESGGTSTRTLTYYNWLIDVRVVPVSTNGKPSKAKPSIRKDLPEQTVLPGGNTPALVFLGPTKDEKKALMLVSSNVKATFGDAVCVLGGESCELLVMEKGIPETFVYGANERIFRIELRDIRLVATKTRTEESAGPAPSSANVAPNAADALAVE
jgi:hypothetical protein